MSCLKFTFGRSLACCRRCLYQHFILRTCVAHLCWPFASPFGAGFPLNQPGLPLPCTHHPLSHSPTLPPCILWSSPLVSSTPRRHTSESHRGLQGRPQG